MREEDEEVEVFTTRARRPARMKTGKSSFLFSRPFFRLVLTFPFFLTCYIRVLGFDFEKRELEQSKRFSLGFFFSSFASFLLFTFQPYVLLGFSLEKKKKKNGKKKLSFPRRVATLSFSFALPPRFWTPRESEISCYRWDFFF